MARLVLVLTILFLPSVSNGQGFRNDRTNVYLHDGNRESIHHSGPANTPSLLDSDSCFPYGCGGIKGPFKNPDPNARKPENLTACIYGQDDVLLYQREGKVCSPKYGVK